MNDDEKSDVYTKYAKSTSTNYASEKKGSRENLPDFSRTCGLQAGKKMLKCMLPLNGPASGRRGVKKQQCMEMNV